MHWVALSFYPPPGLACELDRSDKSLPGREAKTIAGDTAYDANARVIEPLLADGDEIVTPPRRTGKLLAPMTGKYTKRCI